MATGIADSDYVAALLQEGIGVLEGILRRSDLPQERRPGLRRALQILRRELARVRTCRHRGSRARRRCLQRAVQALLELLSEL